MINVGGRTCSPSSGEAKPGGGGGHSAWARTNSLLWSRITITMREKRKRFRFSLLCMKVVRSVVMFVHLTN